MCIYLGFIYKKYVVNSMSTYVLKSKESKSGKCNSTYAVVIDKLYLNGTIYVNNTASKFVCY
jgi:hypothetical protein